MTLAPRELIIAYATFAEPYGVGLYASAGALRQMAALLQTGEPADMALAAPPNDLVEAGAVRSIQILPRDDGPLDIRTAGGMYRSSGALPPAAYWPPHWRVLLATLGSTAQCRYTPASSTSLITRPQGEFDVDDGKYCSLRQFRFRPKLFP